MIATAVDTSWTFAPIVLIALAVYGWIYTTRWRTARAQGGARAASGARLALWWGGIAALFLALVSPIDRISDQLMTAHMIQHLLLADIAPILFTLALTKHILRPATRHVHRIERAAGPFAHPVFGVIAYVGAMWLWHIPALYDAALEHGGIHVLEHFTFALAGLLYWWHLLSPIRGRMRLGGLGPVLYMGSTKILVGFLGVLLAFSPSVLYSFYDHGGSHWGLSPLDDQHVAGLTMALEQSLVMGVALAYLFIRMLSEADAEDQRAERYVSPSP